MNHLRIKVRFRDNSSGSNVTAIIDSIKGVKVDDALWPADQKFITDLEALLEKYRNRFPKSMVPKSKRKK